MAQPSLLPTVVIPHALWSGTVRVMRSPPADAAHNMAMDEAMLATAAATGETLLRLYSWDRPSVSFGRNQTAVGVYSAELGDAAGIPMVRRLTGGRALLHAREVTYCVAAPVNAAPTLRGGYEAINALLLDALQALDIPVVRAAPTARTASPGLAPCFETPSAGELVVGAQKLVGSAQHRDAEAFLQHGSILLDDDQGLLQSIALVPLPAVPPPATLGQFGIHDAAPVADTILQALRRVATGDIVVTDDAAISPTHRETALMRYRDPHWTWRR